MSTIRRAGPGHRDPPNHGSLLERRQVHAVGLDPRRAHRHRRRVRHPAPINFLSAGNLTNIMQNVSILAVLGVGMTFVIITSGIDLSVGSVLVFSSVVAAKMMEAMGGEGWGAALVGIVVAMVSGCSGASSTGSSSPRPRSRR